MRPSRCVIWVKPRNPSYDPYPYPPSLSTFPGLIVPPPPSFVPDAGSDFIVGEGWEELIWRELQKDYFQKLLDKIYLELPTNIYPDRFDVFAWTKYCRPEEVKVVIVGQDPYHDGAADGLAFSMRGKKPQYSLGNIMKLLPRNWDQANNRPRPNLEFPLDGNLEGWARKGVLLLNRMLTVRKGGEGSHKDLGWKTFTDNILKFIQMNFWGIVFILWGKEAKKLCSILTTEKNKCLIDGSYKKCPACPPTAHHCLTHVACKNCGASRGTPCGMSGNVVLQSGHPSPLAVDLGGDFLDQNHLLMANEFLDSIGKKIDWEYGFKWNSL